MIRKKLSVRINQAHAGLSLGTFLRQELHFTKAQIKSMKYREDGLLVNGVRSRTNTILKEDDQLELRLEDEEKESAQLVQASGTLRILYEDADLIALWKESGEVLHPSHGHYQDTISNVLHEYLRQKGEPAVIRSIGRLDRDTSGIVVFAKNQVTAARLWKQKEDGIFCKEYEAVCRGQIPRSQEDEWITIDKPIGKKEGDLMRMCVDPAFGKPAVTHFRVIRTEGDETRVAVRIDTGRTHQIRVHMASIGYPLVGDILYDPEAESAVHPMILCAGKSWLKQPFTGKDIYLSCIMWDCVVL